MRQSTHFAAVVSICTLVMLAAPCATGGAGEGGGEGFPPHPLWPDQRQEKPEACEMLFPVGVDASLWNTNLWPGGVVPYAIDAAVTQQNRDRLRIAMDELQTYSNVTFVPRTNQPNFIRVQNSTGNNSFVGQIGGSQTVNLASWSSRYTIVHELMHALGVWHEQNRSDRDTYVIINPANIQSQFFNPNFTLLTGPTPTGAYDFESIMHYDACSFSTCCPTGSTCACPVNCRSIDVQPAFAQFANLLGNRSFLSTGDKSGMVGRYGPPLDDALEDNDTLATAIALPVGATALRLTDTDDYFDISGNPSDPVTVTVSVTGVWSQNNLSATLLGPGGIVLDAAAFSDADADGTFTATFIRASSAAPLALRFNRAQPWGGQYTVSLARVCLAPPPSSASEPQSATVPQDSTALFTFLVNSTPESGTVTYQWFATTNNSGVPGTIALNDGDRGGRITQTTTAQLRISNVQLSDRTTQPLPGVFANRYFCVASNPCEETTSQQATLTVPSPCLGDLTADGVVNVVDLTIFLGAFGTAVPQGTGADLDNNGVVNVIDLTIFLGRFGQACP